MRKLNIDLLGKPTTPVAEAVVKVNIFYLVGLVVFVVTQPILFVVPVILNLDCLLLVAFRGGAALCEMCYGEMPRRDVQNYVSRRSVETFEP